MTYAEIEAEWVLACASAQIAIEELCTLIRQLPTRPS